MPPLLHAYGLGSFEMGVARTLSERTDDSGDRLDRECGLALPRSYSYGYGDWYYIKLEANPPDRDKNLEDGHNREDK